MQERKGFAGLPGTSMFSAEQNELEGYGQLRKNKGGGLVLVLVLTMAAVAQVERDYSFYSQSCVLDARPWS